MVFKKRKEKDFLVICAGAWSGFPVIVFVTGCQSSREAFADPSKHPWYPRVPPQRLEPGRRRL